MLSIPPATTTSTLPASNRSCPMIAACMPEPHILFNVVHTVDLASPAASAAWRAGAWPSPAGSTQPISTSCTASAASPLRSTAARIATAPNSGAGTPASSPCSAPMGVRALPTMTIGSCCMRTSSACRHAQGAVETDHLAIEHGVFDDMAHQRRVFLGHTQAWRERHIPGQGATYFLGHAGHHRRLEDPRGDGHDPDAMARQFPRCRQGHADNTALGGGIGGLTDLAIVGSYRGGIDDHPALALLIRTALRHYLGDQSQHIEAAQQVDPQCSIEAGQRMGAVTAEDLFPGGNPGAVDQAMYTTEVPLRRCHCLGGLLFIGNIGYIGPGALAQLLAALLQ